MTQDRLEKLLTEADDAAGAGPSMPTELASRVQRAIVRRKRVRAASLVTVLLAGVVGIGLVAGRRHTREREIAVVRPTVPTNPAAELAAIRRDIAEREQLVNALLTRERIEKTEATAAVERELPADRVVAERAAAVFVWQAGRVERETGRRREAEAAYANVVRFFPDTVSAERAKKQLERIRKEGGV